MAFLYSIASGSSGNSVLVSDGETHILIDAGVSMRRVSLSLSAVGISLSDISAIFITHEHTDHISGLSMIAKRYKTPVFATCPSARFLSEQSLYTDGEINILTPGAGVFLGDMEIFPFDTPHDTPESVGFKLKAAGKSVTLVTDLGYVPGSVMEIIKGSDILYIEANHDINTLRAGRYPAFIKKRILSERGHLSNDACAEAVCFAAEHGTRQVVLAHLSRENNTPQLAYETVKSYLAGKGVQIGRDMRLLVAPWECAGELCYL